jgi:isopenicillin N synthase-like dioxygenase
MSTPVAVVDLEQWRSGRPDDVAGVLDLVRDAVETSGFLIVLGHGMDLGLAGTIRREARAFFALDDDVKSRYAARVGVPGWTRYGVEANAYASGESSPPDLKEGLNFGPTSPDGNMVSGTGLVPPVNQFPAEVPALEPAVVAWIDQGLHLAAELLELIARAIGAPGDLFTQHSTNPVHSLGVARYLPACTAGASLPGQYRIGPHTDFGMVTILDREPSVRPLEVQLRDGTWVDAPWMEGSLTINVGDLLSYWTGGRLRSNPHRLRVPPAEHADEELVSLVLFVEGDPEALMVPLAPPIGHAVDWPPMTVLAHLQQQMAAITVGA